MGTISVVYTVLRCTVHVHIIDQCLDMSLPYTYNSIRRSEWNRRLKVCMMVNGAVCEVGWVIADGSIVWK